MADDFVKTEEASLSDKFEQATKSKVSPPPQESYQSTSDFDLKEAADVVSDRLQSILTLNWLSQHYEPVEGVSLPRCLIYKHYSDFCQRNQLIPVNAASFGKVIRQVFPYLRTRRLGTRGQSKYHYYGLRVKESSPYFGEFLDCQRVFSTPTLYRTSGFPMHSSKAHWEQSVIPDRSGNQQGSMASASNLLPEFPTAAQTQPWNDVEFEQIDAVISAYRCHCQHIIEIILRGRLEEVPGAVQEYWKTLPDTTRFHLLGASSDKLADMLTLCDNIMYHTLASILLPGILQSLPPSLLHAIRHFSCALQKVFEESLPRLTEHLYLMQVKTVKRFCQLLKRKTSLVHLAQATRAVLKTKTTVTQMSHDWRKRTEQNLVCHQLMWTVPGNADCIKTVLKKCFSQFSRLLEKHAGVEDHIKWLHDARNKCLNDTGDGVNIEEAERNFLLQWSYVCNLLIRDQTLRSATSFGSFHLLHLLYEEYLLYMVDVEQNQKQEKALWSRLFDTDADVCSFKVSTLTREFILMLRCHQLLISSYIVFLNPVPFDFPTVPSYFLTSVNTSEFDGPKHTYIPIVMPQTVYKPTTSDAMMGTSKRDQAIATDPSSLTKQYGVAPCVKPIAGAAASGLTSYAKPLAAAAAGRMNQTATLRSSTCLGNKNLASFRAPFLNPVPVSTIPSKQLQGYSGSFAASSPSLIPTWKHSSSLQSQQATVSNTSTASAPGVVTIPLEGGLAYLPGTLGKPITILGGYKPPAPPVALTIPQYVAKQVQQGATPSIAQQRTREPSPLQPIARSVLGSSAGGGQSLLRPQSMTTASQKPQQKLLATKIIKAVPVSSDSKQKPLSFQFSITTSQKLNLSKGQILTTTNGDRYMVNEVQSTSHQEGGDGQGK